MLVDFPRDVLPTDQSHTYDPRRNRPFAPSTWREIIAKSRTVIYNCVSGHSTGGWIQVAEEIAVLVLPQSSIMRINWGTGVEIGIGSENGTATIRRNRTLDI